MVQTRGHGILQSSFYALKCDIIITLWCAIVEGWVLLTGVL